jgi:hypothetical protein
VHRVAGRESLVTPVATPAGNAVDDEPAVFSSKEVANRTGSITHEEISERAYEEASVIKNELHTDLEDLPLGLGIQRPRLNSSQTNEISQRLTVLVCSTILNGTFGPFSINNEHRDKPLQAHVDECVEQTGKYDQPYPSAPPAGSDHLDAGSLNLSEHAADEPLPCFCSADD